MRLEWLEDLVAIFETGSLSAAAAQRYLTQPAFSRRVRSIEEYLGVALLDRSSKPARPSPALEGQERRLRELAAELRDLIRHLRLNERQGASRVVIASQHAITTAVLPQLIARDLAGIDAMFRLRSANRAECTAMLITKEADLAVTYCSDAEIARAPERYMETRILGDETLVAVGAPALRAELRAGRLKLIGYPEEVFLGAFMKDAILRDVAQDFAIDLRVETALTLAALQLAIAGVGVAWVPEAMARPAIAASQVTGLSDILPTGRVTVVATRLIGRKSALEDAIWHALPDRPTAAAPDR